MRSLGSVRMTTHLSSPIRHPRALRGAALLVLLALSLLLPGCVRVLAIGAKVILGDPSVKSIFEQRTGLALQKGQHEVALVIDIPHLVADDFGTLAVDLQDEMIMRLRRQGITVADPDEVARALEKGGRKFSATLLAQQLDVDCIVHVQVEKFTDSQSGNPSLLQCHAQGMVRGYEVRGERGSPGRHVVEVYEQSFLSTYPNGHPLAADQTPRRKFLQNSTRKVAEEVSRQFYDVPTSELF